MSEAEKIRVGLELSEHSTRTCAALAHSRLTLSLLAIASHSKGRAIARARNRHAACHAQANCAAAGASCGRWEGNLAY